MTKEMERLKEIEARKAELREELTGAEEVRIAEITEEAKNLNTEEKEVRAKMEVMKEIIETVETPAEESRSAAFRKSGRMETRAVLQGVIAKPSKAAGVEGLGEVPSSIVDDVYTVALNGMGAYTVGYKETEAAAAAVTDGSAVTGTAATWAYKTINPSEWGVLDQVSNMVKKLTDVDYMSAVENSALIALRSEAASKIVTALGSSTLTESVTVALDQDYLRTLLLGFSAIEGKGEVKLYLNRHDLQTLGKIRGTNEKRPLYNITYDQGTTTSGIISEGGSAVQFRIIPVANGTQYFGQPKTIHMPMWGGYEISTDEGGKFFENNQIGVRGLQVAGADLCAKYGMQKVANS